MLMARSTGYLVLYFSSFFSIIELNNIFRHHLVWKNLLHRLDDILIFLMHVFEGLMRQKGLLIKAILNIFICSFAALQILTFLNVFFGTIYW
jgi:hypothetical protein